jgi:hypothetical protein
MPVQPQCATASRFSRRAVVAVRRFGVALTVAAIGLLVAGCGGGSSSSSTKQSTPSTVGASSHALPPGEVGTYLRPSKGAATSTALTLNADGRYTQTISGGPPNGIHGAWSFHNGRITYTETGGSNAACTGVRGTYSWSYANKTLTLRVVSDSRGPRSQDFPGARWRQRS